MGELDWNEKQLAKLERSKPVEMKLTQVATFINESGVRVEFYPVADCPGFTHKVIVMRNFQVIAKDWFAPVNGRISKKTAAFYFAKHAAA